MLQQSWRLRQYAFILFSCDETTPLDWDNTNVNYQITNLYAYNMVWPYRLSVHTFCTCALLIKQWRREGFKAWWHIPSLHSPPIPLLLLPLKIRALEVGPLNPARGSVERCTLPSGVWGKVPAANDFGAFWGPRNATITSKMCIVVRTWFILLCPFLPQQSSRNFYIFRIAKKYRTLFWHPLSLFWRPEAYAPSLTIRHYCY